jgi:protein-disulfide isomerase
MKNRLLAPTGPTLPHRSRGAARTIVAAAALTAIGALSIAACARDDSPAAERLTAVEKRLAALETRQARAGAARAGSRPAPRGPDPSAIHPVDIDGVPFVGAAHAPVTVVEAFEFACPACRMVTPTVEALLAEYEGDIKVVFKNLVVHPQVATAPAQAACAANKQGKFKAMYDAIWTQGYEPYRAERDPSKLAAPSMEALATAIGLDMSQYARDFAACAESVAKDGSDFRKIGVNATPGFFINGRYLRGAQPLPRLKAVIDEELARASERIEKGEASRESYYETFVLAAAEG